MTVIIAAIVGFLAGRMLWIAMRQAWHRPPFMRTNYQGTSLPTAAGIVIACTLVLVEAVRAIMGAAGMGNMPGLTSPRAATLIVVLGFAALGLIDDLVGTSEHRGLMGHLKALGRGELTTGAIKMFVGVGLAVIGAATLSPDSASKLIINAAVIALCANFFNLLDVRPGRSGKMAIAIFVLLALGAGFDTALVPAAIVVGAAAALMLDDLHERLMLGDTGANALGAGIGLGLVTQLHTTGAVIALVVLAGLNILSEMTSFTTIIESVAPLRALDNIGRRRPTTVDVRERATSGSAAAPRPRSSSIRATVGGAHEGVPTGVFRPVEPDLADSPVANDLADRGRGSTRPFRPADLRSDRPADLRPDRPTELHSDRPADLRPDRSADLRSERPASDEPSFDLFGFDRGERPAPNDYPAPRSRWEDDEPTE